MARVTRSSKHKEAVAAETTAESPKIQADIPIRSIETHEVPTGKQVKEEKTPSSSSRNRTREYNKKKRHERVKGINASDKSSAEKRALRADIYKTFRTQANNHGKLVELQQLTEAQQHEIAELKKQLAQKQIIGSRTPKANLGRRKGFK